jgi:predicted lipoprotein with Yx(FWY)xxD motif
MKTPALVAVTAAALLTLSACGSGSSGSSAQQSSGGSGGGAGHAGATGVSVAHTSLGDVLVNGQGMTLYVLSADGMNHSTCSTSCLQFWPAAAPGGAGKLHAKAGRTATPDGTPIATVAGHPLYSFSLDQKPGDVKGEGINEFGGTWYAAGPDGLAVTGASSSSTGTSTGNSTGTSSGTSSRGYGY